MQLFVSESFGILGHVFDGKINMFIRTTRPTDLSSVGLRIGCLNPSVTMGPPPSVYVISGGPLYMCVLHIITCYIGLPRRMSYILPSRELQCLEVRSPGGSVPWRFGSLEVDTIVAALYERACILVGV